MTIALEAIADLLGETVVLDTATPLVYVGRLVNLEHGVIWLEDVDVHDSSESQSTKELYLIEARRLGVRANRKAVRVAERVILSISKLDDVIPFG